jgi:hypothetical protein
VCAYDCCRPANLVAVAQARGRMDTFYTERWAAIRDRRLAYPYWGGVVITALLGLKSLIVERGYLELDEHIRGVIRPRLNNHRLVAEAGDTTTASHEQPTSSKNSNGLPFPDYCDGDDACTGQQCLRHGCEHWDPLSASRVVGDSDLFVVTRVQERHEVAVCPPAHKAGAVLLKAGWGRVPSAQEDQQVCRDGFTTEWVRAAFVQAVEEFVVQTAANIEAPNFAKQSRSTLGAWQHNNYDLKGVLLGPGGEQLAISRPGTNDAFPLRTWLASAGVSSLDSRTDARKTKQGLDTYRHEGAVLEVNYEYSNSAGVNFFGALMSRLWEREPAPFEYRIQVERVAGSEFKLEEVVNLQQRCGLSCPPWSSLENRDPDNSDLCCGTSRVVRRLHGLLMRFEHSGTAGQFSFSCILNHMLVALGSATLIKTLLDYVWIYVFPALRMGDYNEEVFKMATVAKSNRRDGVQANKPLFKFRSVAQVLQQRAKLRRKESEHKAS